MRSVDVAIVGGGMVGCAAAIALRRRGRSVAIFDPAGLCRGASAIDFGGVRRHGRKLAELTLAQRARQIWSGLAAQVGTDGEFVASGHIYVAPDDAAMASLERFHQAAAAYGVATQLLTAAALQRLCPWLEGSFSGGSLCPDDGHANPRLVAAAFAHTAAQAGVVVETAAVTRLERHGDGFVVHTAGEPAFASHVVNAANAGAAALAAAAGDRVDVRVVAPTCMVTEPLPALIRHNVGVLGGDLGLRQVARGNVVIGGGHSSIDPQTGLARPLPRTCAAVLESAGRWAPALRTARLLRSWAGVESVTADGLPVLGRSAATPHLVHAFGFSEHGFQIAPAAGEVVAELIEEGRATTPIDALSPGRFRSP